MDATSQRWSRGLQARGQEHKKIRGQGQGTTFREQTLSRSRTGMLEAKDQGRNAQVLSKQKKKVFSQIFREISGVLKKKVFAQKSQILREISGVKKKVMTLARF